MNLSRHGRREAWWIASIVCLIVGLLSGSLLQAQDASRSGDTVKTKSDITQQPIVGFVLPSKRAVMGAPIAGIVEKILVEEGAEVKAGEAVAQMDDGIQASALEISLLEIEQQAILLNEAELEYEKAVALEKENVLNEWELRVAKVKLEGAKIGLRYSQKKVERDEVMLKRYRMLAPFSGQIQRVVAEEGETVEQGEEVLLLIAMDELEGFIGVPMDLYGKLKTGKTYRLICDLPDGVQGLGADKVLNCRLKYQEPEINLASRTFQCIFTIDNPGAILPFGFRVELIRPE